MIEILFLLYLSGAFLWAVAHAVLTAYSVSDARHRQAYLSGGSRYAKEALHYFKALAQTPIWPIAMVRSGLSLVQEMQEIARDGETGIPETKANKRRST